MVDTDSLIPIPDNARALMAALARQYEIAARQARDDGNQGLADDNEQTARRYADKAA